MDKRPALKRLAEGSHIALVKKLAQHALSLYERLTARSRVLIVVYGDGYVEAYGEPWQEVKFCFLPRVAAGSEQLAWKVLEETLPANYRELTYPICMRGAGNVSQCPSSAELEYYYEMREALKLLDAEFPMPAAIVKP
jgi:uncharacterized protein YciW